MTVRSATQHRHACTSSVSIASVTVLAKGWEPALHASSCPRPTLPAVTTRGLLSCTHLADDQTTFTDRSPTALPLGILRSNHDPPKASSAVHKCHPCLLGDGRVGRTHGRGGLGGFAAWEGNGRQNTLATFGVSALQLRWRSSDADALAAPPPLTLPALTRIQEEFVEALEELEDDFEQLAALPNEPAECLHNKWTSAHLGMLHSRFQVLARHGYTPDAEGHFEFTVGTVRLLKSITREEVAELPNPFQVMAERVFKTDLPPLSNREMDDIMHKLLEELDTETVWEDVEHLNAYSRSIGTPSKANIMAQLAILKLEATLRVISAQGLDEVEGWVRVMVASQTWAATADRKLTSQFAAINKRMKSALGFEE